MRDFSRPSAISLIGNEASAYQARQNREPADISGKTDRHWTNADAAAGKPIANSPLFSDVPRKPQDQASRILVETERFLRVYGHRKIRVAEVANACNFSAANVYRYFASRHAILDSLASHYLGEVERTAAAFAIHNSKSVQDRISGFLIGLNTALIIISDSEPQISELLADASREQWRSYSHYSGRIVLCIANFLAEASVSGELRRGADPEQEAKRVKAAACALVEPDVIRLCRDKHDANTREGLSRLIAAGLLSSSVSPG